jgi:hypothetical protein
MKQTVKWQVLEEMSRHNRLGVADDWHTHQDRISISPKGGAQAGGR